MTLERPSIEADLITRGIRFHPSVSGPAEIRPASQPMTSQVDRPSVDDVARFLAELLGSTWDRLTADRREDLLDKADRLLDRFWPARND